MKHLLFILFISIIHSVNAQLFINGAEMHSLPQSLIYVSNDSVLIAADAYFQQEGFLLVDKDVVVNQGTLEVDGTVEIEVNFLNNDLTEGITSNSLIQLKGNWTNNNIFNPGLSTVVLAGNTQIIDGTENTSYFNLIAEGNLADVKRLVGVDVEVQNELDLGDAEFATDENILSVTNASTSAILRNNGFVSSLDVGRLERTTNSTNSYLFPTGSTSGVTRYRPLEITPNVTSSEIYGARLANVEATTEGFDVALFSDSLCGVNPIFYHRIYGNAAADLTMFYDPATDGDWDAMAQWQTSNEWDKLPNETIGSSAVFSSISIPSWDDFNNSAFALAIKKPLLEIDEDFTISLGESVELDPIYNGPLPNNIVWSPTNNLSCEDCINPEVSPTTTTSYTLIIDVNEFCSLERDVRIQVLNNILVPSAFSPNSDGVNDVFQVANRDLYDEIVMRVYNRWGELIHEREGRNHGWNGEYKGEKQPIGVYLYYVEAKRENNETLTLSGNLTLIR